MIRHFLPPLNTPKLSPTELIILTLAHDRKSNGEISIALGMKLATIKKHLGNAALKYRDEQQRIALGDLRMAPQIPRLGGMVR